MTTGNILTKDNILQVKDYEIKEVVEPKWGGTVRLRSLTGAGRDVFEKAVSSNSTTPGSVDIQGLRALILTMSIVNEKDELIFTEKDVPLLNAKSADVINRLWEIVQKMNGIGEEGIEQAEKN